MVGASAVGLTIAIVLLVSLSSSTPGKERTPKQEPFTCDRLHQKHQACLKDNLAQVRDLAVARAGNSSIFIKNRVVGRMKRELGLQAVSTVRNRLTASAFLDHCKKSLTKDSADTNGWHRDNQKCFRTDSCKAFVGCYQSSSVRLVELLATKAEKLVMKAVKCLKVCNAAKRCIVDFVTVAAALGRNQKTIQFKRTRIQANNLVAKKTAGLCAKACSKSSSGLSCNPSVDCDQLLACVFKVRNPKHRFQRCWWRMVKKPLRTLVDTSLRYAKIAGSVEKLSADPLYAASLKQFEQFISNIFIECKGYAIGASKHPKPKTAPQVRSKHFNIEKSAGGNTTIRRYGKFCSAMCRTGSCQSPRCRYGKEPFCDCVLGGQPICACR